MIVRRLIPGDLAVIDGFSCHLSDPHLPPLPGRGLRELAGKRALGYLNWTRNRHKYHRRDVLDALVPDMQAQRPDHIAVTGDLVNLALEAEFAPARAWLESVGAPRPRHRRFPAITTPMFAPPGIALPRPLATYLGGDDGNRQSPFRSCAGAGRWR